MARAARKRLKPETSRGTVDRAPAGDFVALFTKTKLLNDRHVPFAIDPREVLQELVAATDQLQQPTPRGVVLLVRVKVLAQLIDALGQDGDLNFGGAGVLFVDSVLG